MSTSADFAAKLFNKKQYLQNTTTTEYKLTGLFHFSYPFSRPQK